MIAVVTGSSGFIGSHLVQRLTADGWTVRPLRHAAVRLDDAAAIVRSDALDGAAVVFHLAGVTKAIRDADFEAGNLAPTVALAEAMRMQAPGARLVLASSQAAAGPAPTRTTPRCEVDAPRPVEGYGRSKLAAERAALAAGVPAVVVRPTAVYGPRDVDFLRLFRAASRGFAVVPGLHSRWFDLAHVDDVVAALCLAATSRGVEGRTFFIGGAPTTWELLADEAARAAGRRARRVRVPDTVVRAASWVSGSVSRVTRRATLLNAHKAALGRQDFWLCDDSAAREALGYAPRRALPDGVRQTYLWYVENGWLRSTRR